MTYLVIAIVILSIGFAYISLSGASARNSLLGAIDTVYVRDKTPQYVHKITLQGETVFAEIADSSMKRWRGLSGRKEMAHNEGMLFLFRAPHKPSFWMKDMRFPIDIIWIDGESKIVDISARVNPDSFPKIFSPNVPVKAVLEVNAGWAEEHSATEGNRVEGIPF